MATAEDQPRRTPDLVEFETVGGDDVTIRLWKDWGDYAARVDVDRDGRGSWTWGVTTKGEAGLLTTTAPTIPTSPDDVPSWLRDILLALEAETIKVNR